MDEPSPGVWAGMGAALAASSAWAGKVALAWIRRRPEHLGDVRYSDADELFGEARLLRDELRAELAELRAELAECREARAEYAGRLDRLAEECREDRARAEHRITKLEFDLARMRGEEPA